MKLQITTISGTFEGYGNRKGSGIKNIGQGVHLVDPRKVSEEDIPTYDCVYIRGINGEDFRVYNVKVWPEVERIIHFPGTGTFIFTKLAPISGNELHAVRIGEREGYSAFVQDGTGELNKTFLFAIIASILFIFCLVGIPMLIMVLWAKKMTPVWRSQIVEVARANGFNLTPVRHIR